MGEQTLSQVPGLCGSEVYLKRLGDAAARGFLSRVA